MLAMLSSEFKSWTEALIGGCPGKIGFRLRESWYRRRFAESGGRVSIGRGPTVVSPEAIAITGPVSFGEHVYLGAHLGSLEIGAHCSFSRNVYVGADFGSIKIGNDVLVAMNVVFRAANHRIDQIPDVAIRLQGHVPGEIRVGDDVWIGANVTLVPGSSIGHHSVIAAGSVVTGEIPPYSLAGGVPARVIRSLAKN